MVSTYTPNIGLEMPAAGDYPSSWAPVANTQYNLIDTAIAGITSVDATGASDVTLTGTEGATNQARAFILVIKGTPSAQISVLVPNTDTHHYDVRSKVTNTTSVIINNVAKTGAGCTVGNGEAFSMYTDGVRCRKLGVVPKGTISFWPGTTGNIPAGWEAWTAGYTRFVKMGSTAVSVVAADATVSLGTPTTGSTGSTVLTEAQMPQHQHSINFTTVATGSPSGSGGFQATFSGTANTTASGSSQGHTHTLSGSHVHPISVTGGAPEAYQLIPIRKYT